MKFRKAAIKTSVGEDNPVQVHVPATLSEAVESTLCPKPDGASFHSIKCLQRECDQCGVALFKLLPAETSEEGSVRWSRYDYIATGKFLPNGQEKKKIALIQKDTPPAELFKYFRSSLQPIPVTPLWRNGSGSNLTTYLTTFLQVMWYAYTITLKATLVGSRMRFNQSTSMLPKCPCTLPYFIAMQ